MTRLQASKQSSKVRRVRLGFSRATAVLVVLALSIGLSTMPIPISQAAEGDSVNITGMNIAAVADSGGALINNHIVFLRGTFTNTSSQAISRLELNLVSTPAIRSRSELAELIADPTSASNLRPSRTFAILRNIAPGGTRNWQITFRGEEVLGANASGVFGFGVQPGLPVAGTATVITTPWFHNADIKPTNVALVLPLTTLNTHLANSEVRDLTGDLAEAERLTNLIVSQSDSDITWLQDAALRSWVNQLMDTTDSQVPINLSNAIESLPPTAEYMPYGHTNLTALSVAKQEEDFLDAIKLSRSFALDRPLFYAPINGSADRETVSTLNAQGVRTIISNEFLRGNARETTSATVTSTSHPVLVNDLAASLCLSGAGESDKDFFKSLTCIQSEIGMMTAESPQSSRSVIVVAPADWKISSEKLLELVASLKGQNWIQLVAFDLVASQQPVQNFVSMSGDTSDPLTRATLRQANELRGGTEILSSLYVDQEIANGFDSARILGFSDLWESETRATQYFAANLALLNTYLTSVNLETSSRITTPEETSEIPITVVNKSDQTVSISVALTSKAKSRFSSMPSDLIQVESGQRVTVPMVITLIGAGVVDVEAYLVAPNGERFGDVENFQISSAAYGQYARTLVWGAFGLLVLLALNNFVKRRKEKRSLESLAR